MFYIDNNKCTGCGACIKICPQGAITMQDDVAVIDQGQCSQCGQCAEVCPAGAIRSRALVYSETIKGGNTMRGRGWFGGSQGSGFGFRGSSPPWPYVGRGRGGLPRCGYFLSGAGALAPGPYQPPPFYAGMPATPGYAPYTPGATKEEELNYLKDQAEAIKEQLEQIEARMRDIESAQKE